MKNANLSGIFLVSYDVTSLFTNFSLQETIDIVINLTFSYNTTLNITKEELKKLFLLLHHSLIFFLRENFIYQIDGVAMGSPLAPVLANIFMGFYESKWLNEYNFNKPKFYLTDVDDILAAFEKEQDSVNFVNFLNNKRPSIKFTLEKQVYHSIAFLDVFISGIDNQILTLQTHQKSTYTGLLLNLRVLHRFHTRLV